MVAGLHDAHSLKYTTNNLKPVYFNHAGLECGMNRKSRNFHFGDGARLHSSISSTTF